MLSCTSPADPWWRIALIVATPLLVLVSALIAWRSLRNARSVARQKATLDLIEKFESTEHYRGLRKAFAQAEREALFLLLNDPETPEHKQLRIEILDYLNHYELVAIGIANDILDDSIYRSWMQSHVVKEWNDASGFIQSERWRLNKDKSDFEYRPTIFGALQEIVRRWSREAIVLDARSSPKPTLPQAGREAPGDAPLPTIDPIESDG